MSLLHRHSENSKKRVELNSHSFVITVSKELPPPHREHSNPFEVHFAKEGWRVIVEGHSYGSGAGVTIGAPDGRKGYFHYLVTEAFWNSIEMALIEDKSGHTLPGAMLQGFWKEFPRW